MMPEDFHFIRPEWFSVFIPGVILFALIWHARLNKSNWESVCDTRLLPYLLVDKPTKRNRWPLFWLAVGGVLVVLAMAGPTWERLPSPVFRNESALVIVLDLSASMDAQDVKPSRLDRSRFKIKDILDRRKDGQTALVVYGGDAYTVTPLTEDVETIGNHLLGLNTSLMPSSGSNASRGLIQAEQLLKQAGLRSGHILLITDGVNLAKNAHLVERLKSESYFVSVMGVGTVEGAPIPRGQGGFLKDSLGNIVIPRLKAMDLEELASKGGGVFHIMTGDNRDVDAFKEVIDQSSRGRKEQESDLRIEQWDEKGPWLLLVVLPIAACAFRKGVVAVFVLTLGFPFQNIKAMGWDELWATPNQMANRAFQAGELEKAARLFDDSKWKGAAAYRAGEFDKTVEALKGLDDLDSLYNMGNALANLNRYSEALDAYKRVLQSNPDHQDARFNKELIEERLKQEESQDSPNQSSEDQEEDQQNPNSGDRNDSDNQTSTRDSERNQQDSTQQIESDENKATGVPEQQGKQEGEESSETGNEDEIEKKAKQPEPTQDMGMPKKSEVSHNNKPDETQQANEQWLRRIPDDPGRLLREKFRYQYSRRDRGNSTETEAW